ncbi:MAG: rRNA cytosine-C5-methyltransferase [Deltaproteobacteria bacterium HGW-Deltaproteobacteria-14]|jgi:16S rRNA (cytosine1407-C5)-methyltransferase|nr:MAG: rRNA cytosine-C5-methyltransferase [Deltaproteobacteria bacterium HGW-Deltaproteobacteria-14]
MTALPELPAAFEERLRVIVPPAHLAEALASFTRPRPLTVRVNTLRADPGAVAAELTALGLTVLPLPWCPEALHLPDGDRRVLTESAPVCDGRAYVQGQSSLLATLALDPRPGEENLDLAAAPGGKTLHIAARMADRGRLAAIEPIRGRFFRLKANIARAGATIVALYQKDGRAVGGAVPDRFDRVLLDAPCSSEARFTRLDPASWAHWSPRKVAEAAKKQRGLLASALTALRPGGRLVYCTCSFAPEENERVVSDALARRPEVDVVPWQAPIAPTQPGLVRWDGRELDPRLVRAVRVLPNAERDGFFVCVLTKAAASARDA